MTKRMIALLERAARVRRMIEDRVKSSHASDLQILRLTRHWLLVRRHLEQCYKIAVPSGPALMLARVHRAAGTQRG